MKEYKLSIKEWAVEDRPREKMMRKGIQTLSDAELLAILIGSGTREESAVELARRIMHGYQDNLNNLAKAGMDELCKLKGIGEARGIAIIAALELGRRRATCEVLQRNKISSSKDVADIFQSLLGDLPYEEFWVLLLNRSNYILERLKISQGGIAGTVTDVRIILKTALDKLASSMILVHNHPSGHLVPSDADRRITTKLKEAGALMEIAVLDHVIVSEQSYYSFADEGTL
jgi:DNA repair protein RadC